MMWNVYRENVNRRKIEVFNIFDHGGFSNDVEEYLAETQDKEEFAKKLKSSLMYYFWSKCEHEVVVSGWPRGDMKEAIKIDVHDQVMLNWDVFVEYVWSHREQYMPKRRRNEV